MSDKGSPLSAGMAKQLAEQFEASHDRNLVVRHEALSSLVNGWLEAHEQDLASMVRPHLTAILEDDSLPEPVKSLFQTLARPEHQTQFFTAIFAIQGIINTFVNAALGPYVQDVSDIAWDHHPIMPLSPAELALATLRGNLGNIDAYGEARKSGIDSGRFDVLTKNTGEPPGLQSLNEAYRRNIIDDNRLEHGIRQSRVRNEWIDVVKALRYMPPSPAEVLRGRVQNHLEDGPARKMYEEGGHNPKNYDWQLETAGRPPGIMELIQLWRRDEVTEAQVEGAIRESDIKNKYIDAVKGFKRHVLPQRTVVSAVRHGVIDDAYAHKLFQYEGIAEEDIRWLLEEAHATKAQTQKELALGVHKALYSDGYISRQEFIDRLVKMRYREEDATEIVNTVEYARQHAVFRAAINKIGTLYVNYRIDKSDAGIALDKLTVQPEEKNRLLNIWTLERESNTKDLTRADIDKAYKHGLIDDHEYLARLQQIGYRIADAHLLHDMIVPPPDHKTKNGATAAKP